MKSEDQVVSVEPSKELKDLGAKQDSVWFWNKYITSRLYLSLGNSFEDILATDGTYIQYSVSAFTVAELGEMLPYAAYSMKLCITNKNPPWFCDAGLLYPRSYDNAEADARAKMLIYLIKEGIIKVDDIK